MNQDIKAMLAKITEPVAHVDWVRKLTQVEFSINNTVHSTTKYDAVWSRAERGDF